MTLFYVVAGDALNLFKDHPQKQEILHQIYADYYFDAFNINTLMEGDY